MNARKRSLPDFIGIGTQRSGTSWLYRRLGDHPELWLPPIKEIHFFDRQDNTVYSHKTKLRKDLRQRYRAYKSPNSVPQVKGPNLYWDIKYFLMPTSLSWYSSLFTQGKDRVTGEITPEYMFLSKDVVEKIYVLNPHMKIILLMRDPIDRVWSAAVRNFTVNRKIKMKDVGKEELLGFARSQSTISRTNYLSALSIWEAVFPSAQIHIDFFDNIQENPDKVLLRIFDFLNVEPNIKYMKRKPKKKVASSTKKAGIPIPNYLEYEICTQNIEQLYELSQRFGGHASKWLERAENILVEKQS